MPNKPEIFEVSLHVLMNDDLKGQNFYHISAKCLWKETVVIVFIADVVFSRLDLENNNHIWGQAKICWRKF